MSARRTAVLGGLVWLMVVALTSTLVWVVISRAGQGVLEASGSLPDGASPSTPGITRGVRPDTGGASPSQGESVRPSASPSPGTAEPTMTSPSESVGSTTPPQATGPAQPGETTASSGSAPTSTSSPAERRVWQGSAGVIVVECRDRGIRLVGAQPNSGWSVEVEDDGPETVEVKFREKREDGDEVEVHAQCEGGKPNFENH